MKTSIDIIKLILDKSFKDNNGYYWKFSETNLIINNQLSGQYDIYESSGNFYVHLINSIHVNEDYQITIVDENVSPMQIILQPKLSTHRTMILEEIS